jgi:hypothetical protein
MKASLNPRLGIALRRFATVAGTAVLLAGSLLPSVASAAQITGRSVLLSTSSPAASAATTTYSFAFTVPTTGTAIKSVAIAACTTAIGACTTPTGFSNTVSTLASQPTGLGAAAGWTVNTATAGSLRILDAANVTVPSGAQAIVFGLVQNPTTATGVSFYMRVTTYSDAAWTTPLDTGTEGASTANLIVVNADVAESLTFSTGTSGGTCAAIAAAGTTLQLAPDPLSTGSVSTGTSLMCAATNASSGFNIQYLATQFNNGAVNFANGYGVGGAASSPGTEEFGINAALTSGSGGVVTAPYNAANYAFNPTVATSLASAAVPLTANIFTVTYSANVNNTSKPGNYVSTFTYICTGQF